MPVWLNLIFVFSLLIAILCAVWIAHDCRRYPQRMGIMNLVWPLCALFGSLPLVWFYRRHGRATGGHTYGDTPMPIAVAKGALHCGSGCMLGDMIAETMVALVPAVLVPLGWPGLFDEKMFAAWVLDFIFAFGLGIVFQYFAIAPMRGLGPGDGIVAALKADALSLISWQVGMYGAMAIAVFGIFRPLFNVTPDAASPAFWFAMQFAMIAGLATAYPMNWWLIRAGIKERM
ncbi:MAG: DUF4396 domain-containing protein [Rhodobiaceae bacterium]|nr:DUF4396 domain-containing protein [Rhodobiaceae bacterium]MCC0055093.1 DUF4396 domain-containing protein [Rhodobiaceae bacterium]